MRYTKTRVSGTPTAARLDPEDEQLLVAVAKAEKLTMSDTIRRAIRHYAKFLGVSQPSQSQKVA
jgi:hypothetical protein